MTNAALMLHVSQPSVSKVLAHTEQQLGYLLFDRVKGKLVATPEAHSLFAHVSTVYQDVDRLRHVAENLRSGNSGRIRVAGTPAFGIELLPKAVAGFREQHKDIVFEIETLHLDQMIPALFESRVDIGLAFEPVSTHGIEARTLASSRFVVIAPLAIDFGKKTELSSADLCGLPFIGLTSRGPLGLMLSAYLGPVEAQLDIVTWSETYHVAKALVARGVGVTIADEITARSGGDADVQILPLLPVLEFNIKVLKLAAAPLSIATDRFVQYLGQTLEEYLA